jgi:O-antigen/teichoic acid export membrane protein
MFPFVLWTFCDWQNSISLPLLQQVGSFVVVVVVVVVLFRNLCWICEFSLLCCLKRLNSVAYWTVWLAIAKWVLQVLLISNHANVCC